MCNETLRRRSRLATCHLCQCLAVSLSLCFSISASASLDWANGRKKRVVQLRVGVEGNRNNYEPHETSQRGAVMRDLRLYRLRCRSEMISESERKNHLGLIMPQQQHQLQSKQQQQPKQKQKQLPRQRRRRRR